MSHSSTYDPFVLNEIPDLKAKTVLDCGCGRGIWGFIMLVNRNGVNAYMVGLDYTREHLRFDREHRVYDDLVRGTIRFIPFKDASFDFTLASEVIEHLPKAEGAQFLGELERICRGKVTITTPQGFAPRRAPMGFEAEAHQSAWTSGDFKRRGYSVNGIGFRFFKIWLGRRFLFIYGALFYFITPLAWIMPSIAEYLIASKRIVGGNHST